MPPQPAQPEADYVLVFDGGSLGNPGRGYGSFLLSGPEFPGGRLRRREYGDRVTNNEAEYQALIDGLEDLLGAMAAAGKRPEQARVSILGDSQLVLNQLMGRWRVRTPTLRPLHERAAEQLRRFGHTLLEWHPRARSVALLGH